MKSIPYLVNLRISKFFVLIVLAAPTLTHAQETENTTIIKSIRVSEADAPDMTAIIGGGTGTFTPAKGTAKAFAGLLFGVKLNYDNTPLNFTPYIDLRALIDGASNQVIRQSFAGGVHYYLVGGKKRIIKTTKVGDIASSNGGSLAATIKLSQDNYSITPTKVGVDKLQGGVLNVAAGFNATWNYSDTSSFSLEVTNTIVSFAASIEKATATTTDFGIGWRTFL